MGDIGRQPDREGSSEPAIVMRNGGRQVARLNAAAMGACAQDIKGDAVTTV